MEVILENKEKSELIAKIVDALYKKLVILTAIGGGFGAYAINFLQKNSNYGYVFAIVFILISIAIFVTYVKLNTYIRGLEEMQNG